MENTKITIFNCAKKLFASRGFKDTNVSDITNAVGIGVGVNVNEKVGHVIMNF